MSKLETNTIDTVSGTTTLQIGSTNTNTITLGTSGDTITVPTGASLTVPSGGLTGQNYPAFEAHLSANQEMSDATSTKVQFDTERFDTDNCYDNSTNYRFTPTVAGKYFVYCNARLDGRTNSNLNLAQLNFNKNGSLYTESQYYFISSYIRQIAVSRTAIIDMNGSTDYLEIFAYIDIISTGSGNPRINGGSTKEAAFGAYRIGA